MLDDRTLSTYGKELLPSWPLSFSVDGKIVAYALTRDQQSRGRVVVNGREGPEFDSVGLPALSHDGAVAAYRAERNDGHFIRIGDREGPVFDFVTDPALSSDGTIVAYAGERGGRWFLVVDQRETPLSGKPLNVFISADGRSVGWVELEIAPDGGSKMRVATSGERGEPFGIIGKPVFNPAGSVVAYAADEGSRRFVVIGKTKFETPHRVGDPVFSPDGRRVGYGARIGREIWWKVLVVSQR